MESYDTCQHEIVDGSCLHCGLMLESYIDEKLDFSTNCPQISTGKNNILDNLEGIPDDVIARAKSNITERESITGKKVRNDNKNTFIQVYSSYLECGYSNFNPQKLAKKLSLSRKDVNWCLKIASGTSLISSFCDDDHNYTSIVIISPVAYILPKCIKNDIEEHLEEILDITNKILEEKDILYSSRPEYIACAIIKKFCEFMRINVKCFSKVNEISDNALKKCLNDIKEFDYLFLEKKK